MSRTTYHQRNKEVILNRPKDYYENNKEVLREREQKISIEKYLKKKNIKREYGRNRYRNMSEEDKQRLKKYQRNYREAKRSAYFFSLCKNEKRFDLQ